MRKYYPIRNTSDYATLGKVYPQASSYYTAEVLIKSLSTDQKDWKAYESMRNIDSVEVDPNLSWKFILEKKAKFTDLM